MKNLKWVLAVLISFAMGMALSASFSNKSSAGNPANNQEHDEVDELELSKKSQEIIALKTAKVKVTASKKKISSIGRIAQDTENLSYIISPQAGIITQSKVDVGSVVKKGDVVCFIRTNGLDSLTEVKSPFEGVIVGNFVKTGDKVDNISSLYAIADLSKLWANFDIYEKDITDVKIGQKVLVYSLSYPEKVFEGEIVFISPRVDETSRTIKIRAIVDNKETLLKLGMFVSGDIISENVEKYLSVPAHAVQTMGNEKAIFLKTGDQKFRMKKIKIKAETKVEVLIDESSIEENNGIKEGDEVVVEGAFLLKSELSKAELEEE